VILIFFNLNFLKIYPQRWILQSEIVVSLSSKTGVAACYISGICFLEIINIRCGYSNVSWFWLRMMLCIHLRDVTCSLIRDFNFNGRFPNKFEINFFLDEDIETWFSSYEWWRSWWSCLQTSQTDKICLLLQGKYMEIFHFDILFCWISSIKYIK